MTTNVVGSCGGKIILNYKNEGINSALKQKFFAYTRNVDFFTGDSLNKLLKRALREYVIGGDCVLVFDDGLIEDSGKILLFESSEIVNTSDEAIKKHYGKYAYQSQGKVYNANGRHIGTVVSRSQRGVEIADPLCCFFLHKDPNASSLDNGWYHFSSNWREGRGVSPAASAIATLHQLEDLVSSELMASRRNAQIFCWLTQSATQEEEVPSAFNDETDFDNMTDEQVEQAAKAETSTTQTISFNRARENSIVYEALPEGIDAKQLQTTHPNSNVETMVDFLATRCAASLGLSKVFATGNVDQTNWRASQLFTRPTIVEMQKELEHINDWVFFRYMNYLVHKNELEYIDPYVMEYVSWEWCGIDDLNPVEQQNGIRLALENNTKTYKEILGMDWKEKLQQVADEHKWMREHGMIHPSEKLISGGESAASQAATKDIEQTQEQK